MRVPGIVYANDDLINGIKMDRTLEQCANVAHLPGIQKFSITLPDGHEGYGFPIGGVAATDYEEGVISPGGVGYDINCSVRLLTTNLTEKDVRPKLMAVTEAIFRNVPSGLGSKREGFKLSTQELDSLMSEGAEWIVSKGLGRQEDLRYCEEEGCMKDADPGKVSNTAKRRGLTQIGTLGSGNHFLEIGKVEKIFDVKVANVFGITHTNQVALMIHSGSRGLGHQVCSDYLKVMDRAIEKYGIILPDRELACAPGNSKEAQEYYQAMSCAVNYAFSNRQVMTHYVRESFEQVFKISADKVGLDLVYDVAHNIVKIEEHIIDGSVKKVWVHRKGATRSFGPSNRDIPSDYQNIGQPVLIPGTMGSSSWVMVGTDKASEISFGSTAHGAGRIMSRGAAKKQLRIEDIRDKLRKQGIIVKSASLEALSEEATEAYKDVDKVAEVSDELGIATKVARLIPMAVIKG